VQNEGQKPASPSTPIEAITLQFIFTQQQRVIEVTLEREITIGRIDPTSTVFPTVDLSSLGTAAKSVSRHHARIIKRNSEIVLEDLASVNGTFINGKKLAPFLPVKLDNGDVLQLGKISMAIAIGSE
jgi:pSer/pThr/pTyr-binding forkhead associated (FHA) protein